MPMMFLLVYRGGGAWRLGVLPLALPISGFALELLSPNSALGVPVLPSRCFPFKAAPAKASEHFLRL